MSDVLMIFLYSIFAYGISNIIVFGHGPWDLIDRVRDWCMRYSPRFLGPMMSCMMCLPTNLGFVLSLINWFFVPQCITPGNLIFWECDMLNLWWMAMLFDGFFTSGIVWLIHHVEEWFENNTPPTEEIIESDEDITNRINTD